LGQNQGEIDADLCEQVRDLANQRRRLGYRRLHILLRRAGVMIDRKKTRRIYQEEGLPVRRRRIRRRAVGMRASARARRCQSGEAASASRVCSSQSG